MVVLHRAFHRYGATLISFNYDLKLYSCYSPYGSVINQSVLEAMVNLLAKSPKAHALLAQLLRCQQEGRALRILVLEAWARRRKRCKRLGHLEKNVLAR